MDVIDRFGRLAKLHDQLEFKIHQGALAMEELRMERQRIDAHILHSKQVIDRYRKRKSVFRAQRV